MQHAEKTCDRFDFFGFVVAAHETRESLHLHIKIGRYWTWDLLLVRVKHL